MVVEGRLAFEVAEVVGFGEEVAISVFEDEVGVEGVAFPGVGVGLFGPT